MLDEVQAGPYTLRGVSVGGVYTSLQVPELGVVLDAGVPIRSFAGTDYLFLSHGHADHASALGALLGIRNLIGKGPPKVFLPAEIEASMVETLQVMDKLHRASMEIKPVPMRPGDTVKLHHDLWVRAFRTHHPVPSLGYQFLRRVTKLRPEFRELPPEEIARRRKAGDALFDEVDRLELAYATDTLSRVLETSPFLLESRVLILECTYVDERRGVEAAREHCHLHLDEIVSRASLFQNEALVLMHFSQMYSPAEVHEIIQRKAPPELRDRIRVFAPPSGPWFG